MDDEKSITEIKTWRRNVLIIGIVIGAAVGFGAAYLFSQNVDDPHYRPSMTPGDGVKLGLVILGLLRSVADLGNQK